jgi:hypothetical protein
MKPLLLRRMSHGTKRTWRDVYYESVVRSKADNDWPLPRTRDVAFGFFRTFERNFPGKHRSKSVNTEDGDPQLCDETCGHGRSKDRCDDNTRR